MKIGWSYLRGCAGRVLDALGRFRLTAMYMAIILTAAALFGVSLTISNRIARDMVRTEYREYNDIIFEQMESVMTRQIEDLARHCYMIMSDHTLVNFLEEESFSGRMEQMDDMKAAFERMRAIHEDIRAISLHQIDGKIVASTGIKNYIHTGELSADSIQFSGLIRVENADYFSVSIPMFSVDPARQARKIGYCCMLLGMNYFQRSLADTLPGSEFFFQCTDREGQSLMKNGEPPEMLPESVGERYSEVNGQALYQATLPRANWRIRFGVPLKQLYARVNLLQKNYYVTYFIIGLLLLFMFVMIYASVLRPIHRQIRFMNYYAGNREKRMTIESNNEMGELARNLNQMLDDIEQLTERNMEAQNRLLQAEYQKKQSELLAYRNQINPHFLNNAFECIRGIALYHQVEDIAVITEALSRLFSYNLRGKGYAPVRDVKNHIEDYTSIIRYRFNNRFSIETHIDEDAAEVLFPKMVIQPLVENAIFHGLETVEEGGSVRVWVQKEGERLKVLVEDNGKGMTEKELQALKNDLEEFDRTGQIPDRQHGIGLLNIYRRLRLFYGETLQFDVESASGEGTRIRADVPCEMPEMEGKDVPGFSD